MDLSVAFLVGANPDRYSPESRLEAKMKLDEHFKWFDDRETNDLAEFDPNNGRSFGDIHATYVPGRQGPSFKVHESRGRALSALRQNPGTMWRLEDSGWVHIATSRTVRNRDYSTKRPFEITWEN